MVERINLLLKAKNVTARQFAEEIGIQPSGMSHIMSGRNNPSLDFVMKVVKRWPEVNINWLMLGKGEMYASVPLNAQEQEGHSVKQVEERHGVEQYDLFNQQELSTASQPQHVASPVIEQKPQPELESNTPPMREPVARQPKPEPLPPTLSPSTVEEAMAPRDAQPSENAVETPRTASTVLQTPQKKKKVVKMIVVYDDHSFTEYYPE